MESMCRERYWSRYRGPAVIQDSCGHIGQGICRFYDYGRIKDASQMILFLIGLASGIVSGMGMGGGTILIPGLIFLAGVPQHLAQSVNLSVFFPASICALWIHTKNKHVRYKLALKIILVGVIGSLIGSIIAVSMSTQILRKMFGIFILAMGIYEFFRKPKSKGKK
jgi:uncharacterized membrane protein YfcA